MPELTTSQKTDFLKNLKDYIAWNSTSEGKQNTEDHRKHQKYFQERLSPKSIKGLDELKFKDVYKGLWASNIWGNKDWYVENRLLKPNRGLEPIKSELTKLFYNDTLPLAERYDEFKKKIKGLGSSALTELLHFVFPDKYCLWNDKPKTVLPFLGLDSLLPEKVFKYQISAGEDYAVCNSVMDILRKELISAGLKEADFIDLDCYIWFMFIKKVPQRRRGRPVEEEQEKQDETKIKISGINSHEDAQYYLLKLGELFGYVTYTCDKKSKSNNVELGDVAIVKELPSFAGERDLNSARTIDVIWFDEDENPRYCFEVEHTMDISRSLQRLYQLRQFYVSFFVVSPEDKRSKFDIEMRKAPFRNEKDRYKFISYDELAELYKNAESLFKLKNKLFAE